MGFWDAITGILEEPVKVLPFSPFSPLNPLNMSMSLIQGIQSAPTWWLTGSQITENLNNQFSIQGSIIPSETPQASPQQVIGGSATSLLLLLAIGYVVLKE